MAPKPSIPKGMRDFSPVEMSRRNYIFDTIRSVFKLYGYQAIETPAMEQLSTLLGKYGEEGDKLLFKVLNSGNFLDKVHSFDDAKQLSLQISEKGLRYDLTVPFARYVVQHQNEITFPFKRYQMQAVWRADRPQKGRYREFYQCDVDVVGSQSLLNEAELVEIIHEVFARLKVAVKIHINNRKILSGIAQVIGAPERLIDITIAIDKIDKIGLNAVCEELLLKGLTPDAIDTLKPLLLFKGSTAETLAFIKEWIQSSELGCQGIAEIQTLLAYIEQSGLSHLCQLDLTLARGLNYYTGAIFEVKAQDVAMGSISGGGRYDDLTGIFGLKNVSGVGVSFGADRIYDVLMELEAFPKDLTESTRILFLNFGEQELRYCRQIAQNLRQQGVAVEIYPDPVKLPKQMSYADTRAIPWVAMIGQNELENQIITLKNMHDGSQTSVNEAQLLSLIL